MDSMLGALALGDIGKYFPDTDMKYKDISSLILLKRVYNIIKDKGYGIGNMDCIIVAQRPKLASYIDKMKANISHVLNISEDNIGIKATTTEYLGFEGREEGISAYSVCLLIPI